MRRIIKHLKVASLLPLRKDIAASTIFWRIVRNPAFSSALPAVKQCLREFGFEVIPLAEFRPSLRLFIDAAAVTSFLNLLRSPDRCYGRSQRIQLTNHSICRDSTDIASVARRSPPRVCRRIPGETARRFFLQAISVDLGAGQVKMETQRIPLPSARCIGKLSPETKQRWPWTSARCSNSVGLLFRTCFDAPDSNSCWSCCSKPPLHGQTGPAVDEWQLLSQLSRLCWRYNIAPRGVNQDLRRLAPDTFDDLSA